MRTMGVKGLTLFHLKSHLQKYRLGKQSGKETSEHSKDASFLMEGPSSSANSLSPRMHMLDVNEGHEVKEALRAQMEIQRRLHEQVEVQKHLQIRMDSHQKYLNSLFERAIKIAVEQITSTTGLHVTAGDLSDLLSKAAVNSPLTAAQWSGDMVEKLPSQLLMSEDGPCHRKLHGLKQKPCT